MNSILFQEILSSESGFSDIESRSYAVAWGDVNGDKYPDLWLNNHWGVKRFLYINQGDGTFVNRSAEIVTAKKHHGHGAQWADFDNDSDLDIVELVGGGNGFAVLDKRLHVSEEGSLVDRADELGVNYLLGRGRSPLWFDANNDGWLDLFFGVSPRKDGQEAPVKIFLQDPNQGIFEDGSSALDFNLDEAKWAILSDLSGDGKLDLVTQSNRIYDISLNPFKDISSDLLNGLNINGSDLVSGDFNGDLLPDLYIPKYLRGNDIFQRSSNNAVARLVVNGQERGLEFNTTGDIFIDLYIRQFPQDFFPLTLDNIYIGENGVNPTDFQFTLSPEDPKVQGFFPHESGIDDGLYIGYDSILKRWSFLLSSPEVARPQVGTPPLSLEIQSSEEISELTSIGFVDDWQTSGGRLLINTDAGLIDQTEESGLNSLNENVNNATAGDFDNDGDLDLFLVNTRSAGNDPDILYQNQGDGTFIPVPNAGGAAGNSLGIGDSITTVDYDLDGFLDLLAANGSAGNELNLIQQAYQLFRNQGNENHWLQIDLEGVISNRDGIGAQVFVTAGGKTQLREQSGGMHRKVQNHQRLHFGLAENEKIDEILIRWPSGIEQKINNIPANQLLHVIEPSDSFTPGKPIFEVGSESGVFLWKDTFDGPYHLRTVGSEDQTNFQVDLISNETLLEVTPFSLENNDELAETGFGFSLESRLFSSQDGIEFRLAPGAQALFSVTEDGVANPRQLNVGLEGSPLAPDGWIIDSEELPVRPDFTPTKDLGLFVGQKDSPEELEFRWSGDNNFHRTNLSVFSSEDTVSFSTVDLELGDAPVSFDNGVTIGGGVKGEDGLDVTTLEPVKIGFVYEQDSLLQPHRVNPNLQDDLLNSPNAYWLPLATPYGQPEYDSAEESGLFLWKDEQNLWRLRVTAGADSKRRYVGSIVSDSSATSVKGVSLDPNDQINTSDSSRIDFDLQVLKGHQEGIDFSFPADASLMINLEDNSEEATSLFQIGSERWSVRELPLDISGW